MMVVEIDGAKGEGGGQILRTALSLSALTGRSMCITNIRAHRTKPGLMPQHLKAVEAAASVSSARVQGAELRSSTLSFEPGELTAGEYHFDIGTAGATSLVLQTIALPLSFADGSSRVSIIGGTHVPWSPTYHYLAWHWLRYLGRSGFRVDSTLERPGFYPKGGGRITAWIQPVSGPSPLMLVQRGGLKRIRGLSLVANLGITIAERQKRQAIKRLTEHCANIDIDVLRLSAYSPGTALLLVAEFEQTQCCYGALGARGKPAERVADEAANALEALLATNGAIDEFLADQLILPLSLAHGVSGIRVPRITQHLISSGDIVRKFLPVAIDIVGDIGMPGCIKIKGVGDIKAVLDR